MPITMSDLFAMLRNAGNLSLTFPVIEYEGTFFRAYTEYWMSARPADERCFIFIGGKLDVIELFQTHRPDRNSVSSL